MDRPCWIRWASRSPRSRRCTAISRSPTTKTGLSSRPAIVRAPRTPTACAAPAASPSATAVTSGRRTRRCSVARWDAVTWRRSDRSIPEEVPMIVLRALGALLSYPREDLRLALPDIAQAIRASPFIAARERDGLMVLINDLASGDLLAAEERYVELFDRGRTTSLNLFEHLHGESRDRGDAMVELKRRYQRAGFELATKELPDHLPVVLEYLSCRSPAETSDMLRDCAHLLKRIGEALIARESSYAAVVQALLVIAGEAPLDTASGAGVAARDDTTDWDWFEQPAFGGEPWLGGTRTPPGPHGDR